METQAILLIFLHFWSVCTGNTSKQQKIAAFSLDVLSGDSFEAVLAIFYSYDYCATASEGVEKIITNEKDCRKCSVCMIV